MLPEADQTIFFILKQLTYNNCLIKYKDNDILLSALLNFKGMTSGNSRMYLQNLSSKRVVYDVFQISNNIANDSNLSHFIHPVPTLILAFLCVGNNDYSGKIWGMSCETVYKALKKMVTDLACSIEKNNIDASHFLPDHLFTLYSSKCTFSISKEAFHEFIKVLYIEKNAILFKDILQLPFPKNIHTWKKGDLINAFDFLKIDKMNDKGKPMTVQKMKEKLLGYTAANASEKHRLDTFLSEGEKPSEVQY